MWSPDEQAPQASPASSNSVTTMISLRLFITTNNAALGKILCPEGTPILLRRKKKSPQIEKSVYFCIFKPNSIMSHKTAIKVYEIASYVLILAATVLYFVLKGSVPVLRIFLLMMLVALALVCRWMMERHRFRSAEDEIDQLKDDLRRLTQLYAEEKKRNRNA